MKNTKILSHAEWQEIASLTREIDAKIEELYKKASPVLPLSDATLVAAIQHKYMVKIRSMLEDRMIGQLDPHHQDIDGRLLRLFFGLSDFRD